MQALLKDDIHTAPVPSALTHLMSQIDAAYDVLLMDNMRKRLSGEADVAKSVRFADVRRARPKKQVT